MSGDRQGNAPSSFWASAPVWPVAAAAIFIVAANIFFVVGRLFLPYPISEWEAGLVTDAWRMVTGLPVYGAISEHATTMYGPLQMVALAGIFDLVGPSLQAGRVINILSGTALLFVLAYSFGRRDWLSVTVSLALLLAVNGWTNYYFVETRPDMVALFWAVLGLLVLYRAAAAESLAGQIGLAFAGSLLVLVGAFFKQTAVAAVAVPLAAELLCFSSFGRRLVVAAVPVVLAAVAGALLALSPGLWHFMIEVPAQYPLSATMFFEGARLLLSLPLFVLALVHWLFTDARDNWRTPFVRWLMAGVVVGIATSVPAFAKHGAASNSLIAGLLAIGTFCAWRAHHALDLLAGRAGPMVLRLGVASVLAVTLVLHVFPSAGALQPWMLAHGHGVPGYSAMLAEVRKLPGKVVSFDDPWIALAAKGTAGATLIFEADAVRWDPTRLRIPRAIETADYVVSIRGTAVLNESEWWPKEQTLMAAGFARIDFPGAASPVYQLWRRVPR